MRVRGLIAVMLFTVTAAAAVSAASASARVVMGCDRVTTGLLVNTKAHPHSCGNQALGGSTAGITGVRWRHWGRGVASGRGQMIDGLGFGYPARFWVFGRSYRDGVTFYSRMRVISQGENRGGAWRPGINRIVNVTPYGLSTAIAVQASAVRAFAK